MAQKNKLAAGQPVSTKVELPVITGDASPMEVFPVNDFKGSMHFDLDPKKPTSIINGDRILVYRNGIESIMVTAQPERSDSP